MEVLWGSLFGAVTALSGHLAGFDRDRSFYPTMTVVVALVYVLFATMTGDVTAVMQEVMAASIFIGAALLGFRKNLWLIVLALVGHGLFDLLHAHAIANSGVPLWWPGFCGSIDIMLGAALSALLYSARLDAGRRLAADPGRTAR